PTWNKSPKSGARRWTVTAKPLSATKLSPLGDKPWLVYQKAAKPPLVLTTALGNRCIDDEAFFRSSVVFLGTRHPYAVLCRDGRATAGYYLSGRNRLFKTAFALLG